MTTFLTIYSRNPYSPLEELATTIGELDTTTIATTVNRRSIELTVEDPIKQIVFIPGGLVEAESYQYLAYQLALEGYNVTIVKPYYYLAILTPNQASRYLSDTLDNVLIGHSLGGTVASMVASGNDRVTDVIFLASYPIQDVSDKQVLLLLGENDTVLDNADVEASTSLLPEDTVPVVIPGGNHAQFGWYGEQDGDGPASITTEQQQSLVLEEILQFLTP